jgi:acyl dehydratase
MESKPELVFADLPAGRTFRPLEVAVTKDLVQEFMEVVGDRHPLYWDEKSVPQTLAGSLMAPPGLAAIYARLAYLQDYLMPSGGVLAKQEFEFHHPLLIGDTLRVKAKVTESYLDEKGRKRVAFHIEAGNQKGERISIIHLNVYWPK